MGYSRIKGAHTMKQRSFLFDAKTGAAMVALALCNSGNALAQAPPPVCTPLTASPVAPGCTGTRTLWSELDNWCCATATCTAAVAGSAYWGFEDCVPAPTAVPGYCYTNGAGTTFCNNLITIPNNWAPDTCTAIDAVSINCCWTTRAPNSCHTLRDPAATPAPTAAPVCGPAGANPACVAPANQYDVDNDACCTSSTCIYPAPSYPPRLQYTGCSPVPTPAPPPIPGPTPTPTSTPSGPAVPGPTYAPAPSAGTGCLVLGGKVYCTP